jgi:hypothetical protein
MAANANNVADPMATKDPDQVICLNEKLTGSMLPTRVCQTRRNWIRQGVDSRDVIGHAQDVGSGEPTGPVGIGPGGHWRSSRQHFQLQETVT